MLVLRSTRTALGQLPRLANFVPPRGKCDPTQEWQDLSGVCQVEADVFEWLRSLVAPIALCFFSIRSLSDILACSNLVTRSTNVKPPFTSRQNSTNYKLNGPVQQPSNMPRLRTAHYGINQQQEQPCTSFCYLYE